jgi:hypothetical protein
MHLGLFLSFKIFVCYSYVHEERLRQGPWEESPPPPIWELLDTARVLCNLNWQVKCNLRPCDDVEKVVNSKIYRKVISNSSAVSEKVLI